MLPPPLMLSFLLAALAAGAGRHAVVDGAPAEHLITELPGQPELASFRQYSGYVDIGGDGDTATNLFYYFVEADSAADNAINDTMIPLTLWLNGGPGCSSVGGGAFTELGPFYPNPGGHELRRNPNSWNRVANILFLESPAGVGWSYSGSRRRPGSSSEIMSYDYDDSRVARESLLFLRKWFRLFPEHAGRPLLLAGESYAGHYIPQLALLLLAESKEFNLKGVLIGNPLLNYAVDTTATYDFLWSHGVISDETFRGVSRWCDFRYGYMGERQHQLAGGEASAGHRRSRKTKKKNHGDGGCTSFLGSAREEMGRYINIYDVTSDVCPIHRQALLLHRLMGLAGDDEEVDVCADHEISRYLNLPGVQRALHANLTSLPYPWEACSRIVNYNCTDQLADVVPALARLLRSSLPVWIFSGDQDSVVPLTGTRTQITKLARQMKMKPRGSYRPWYAQDQVGGWYESYGGKGELVYATVRGASHMVPYAQPERALVLFASFAGGRPLPPHP